MAKTIVIMQGHPDPAGNHLCHALAEAYASGAREAGHGIEEIEIAKLELPLLRTKEEFGAARLHDPWRRPKARSAEPTTSSSSIRCGSAICRLC
jgi:putative NADPH-quinone reductase